MRGHRGRRVVGVEPAVDQTHEGLGRQAAARRASVSSRTATTRHPPVRDRGGRRAPGRSSAPPPTPASPTAWPVQPATMPRPSDDPGDRVVRDRRGRVESDGHVPRVDGVLAEPHPQERRRGPGPSRTAPAASRSLVLAQGVDRVEERRVDLRARPGICVVGDLAFQASQTGGVDLASRRRLALGARIQVVGGRSRCPTRGARRPAPPTSRRRTTAASRAPPRARRKRR